MAFWRRAKAVWPVWRVHCMASNYYWLHGSFLLPQQPMGCGTLPLVWSVQQRLPSQIWFPYRLAMSHKLFKPSAGCDFYTRSFMSLGVSCFHNDCYSACSYKYTNQYKLLLFQIWLWVSVGILPGWWGMVYSLECAHIMGKVELYIIMTLVLYTSYSPVKVALLIAWNGC